MAKPGQRCSGFVLFGKGEEIQMKNMRILTEEQKIFAEQHHVLVEQFLWKNHLERTEFYDVVRVRMVKERELPYAMEEIDGPEKVAAFIRKFLAGADREYLLVLSMDNIGKLAAIEVVSIGTVNAALAEPREIFKHAILANAAGIVMVHNHTSGRCVPSSEDMEITKRIEKAGKILGIPLMDHIIVGDGYFSFRTEGLLEKGKEK